MGGDEGGEGGEEAKKVKKTRDDQRVEIKRKREPGQGGNEYSELGSKGEFTH